MPARVADAIIGACSPRHQPRMALVSQKGTAMTAPVTSDAPGAVDSSALETPSTVLRISDALICSGIARMAIPEGGAHVRAAEIRIPAHFAGRPAVTATVHAVTGPGGVGTVFGVFNIKVNRLGDQTQVVIQATNVQKGLAVEGEFACDYVVVGNVDNGQSST
jgi:hypothetical protein